MKVVNISSSDWANFSYNFSESLRAVGVDSYSFCLYPHAFGYPKQSQVVSIGSLKSLTADADFVIVHHSCVELLPHISPGKIIHYAAGTKYRQEYHHLNHAFKDAVCTFIALPEFQKTAKNYHYIVGAVDTDALGQYHFSGGSSPFFAHYPSNPGVKGSSDIIRIAHEMGINFRCSTENVSYSQQLERLNSCDIYIELLAPTQGGKPYGSFGMTALEAAAMGKVVITQNNSDEAGLYDSTYGFCGLNFAKDEAKLRRIVETLANYNGEYLDGQKKVTRDWVVKNHSFKATGERALKILNDL